MKMMKTTMTGPDIPVTFRDGNGPTILGLLGVFALAVGYYCLM